MHRNAITAAFVALGITGCAAQPGLPAADDGETGTVSLALTASADDGTVYRLRGAVFTVTGPIHAVLSSELDAEPDAPALETALPTGDYTMRLEDGWSLYRVETDGSETWMQAEITSGNPVAFSVDLGAATDVRFRFLIDSEIAAGDRGDVSVGFDVDEEECPTWYLDCDADGYAPAGAATTQSCTAPDPDASCPAGSWIRQAPEDALTTDCWDADADVHPSNRSRPYFSTPIAGAPASSDFDYDCDGAETMQTTAIAAEATNFDCTSLNLGPLGRSCIGWQGWYSYSLPACGVNELYSFCAYNDYGRCRRTYERRDAACH